MSCPHCNGTGWRSQEVDGVRRVERCDCWRQQVTTTLLSKAKIPSRYRKCDFTTFVTYPNEQLLRTVKKAHEFAEAFPIVDRGMVFIGPPGVGKTHLAVAVLREVILEKAVRGLYYDTRTLLSTIRSTYNPITRTSEADILGRVMRAELLVLDDLGAERLTDWVEEMMHLIVNTRYNDRRPTIFTSNYQSVPDIDGATESVAAQVLLSERVGVRMHSRLREMCEFLEYDGPDYRDFEYPPTSENLLQRWKQSKGLARQRMPRRTSVRARAQLKEGQLDLGWSGGKASS